MKPNARSAALVGLVAVIVCLVALRLLYGGATQEADDNAAVVQTFADQAAEACSDPMQRERLAGQGFSCQAIEDAAEQVEDGGDPVLVPGPQGERGLTGPRGFTGAAGADGADGTRGVAGPAGKAGEPGLPGAIGPIGTTGARGDVGPAGTAGRDGEDGTPGERGPQGEKGDPGRDGVDGATGSQGPAGPQGVPGVVNVVTSPECAALTPASSISLAYDAGTQTLTLICT